MSPTHLSEDATCTLLGDALAQGTVLGRYRIACELGRGSMGTVYKAEDDLIERSVALKVVRRPGTNSEPLEIERYARFLREAKAAGGLSHPNIVTIYDVAEEAKRGVAYLAMELVKGDTLETLIRRGVQLKLHKVRSIGMQVLSALNAAHRLGIVHRDIKPANLMLTELGKVKVTDFGIAKTNNSKMTQDGMLLGSPRYMSPEQVRAADLDHRTDLFSLGVVLYELITLRSPFLGESIYEILQNVIGGEPTPLRTWRKDVPVALEDVVMKALSKDPATRFASAEAMWVALKGSGATTARLREPAKQGSPPVRPAKPAEPTGPETPVTELDARGRNLLLGGLGLLLLLVVGVGAFIGRDRAATTESPQWPPPADTTLASSLQSDEASSPLASGTAEIRADVPLQVAGSGPDPTQDPHLGSQQQDSLSSFHKAPPVELAVTPLPTPMPTPVATRAPRPVMRQTPRPTPEATPIPAVEAVAPSSDSSLPFEVSVKHRHRFGSCHGLLRIGKDSLEYDSQDRDKDDRSWDYRDLRSVSFSEGGVLGFTEEKRDKLALGLKRNNYNFEVLDRSLPSAVLEHLERRINSQSEPSEDEDVPPS